jgi:hypothetical protein
MEILDTPELGDEVRLVLAEELSLRKEFVRNLAIANVFTEKT